MRKIIYICLFIFGICSCDNKNESGSSIETNFVSSSIVESSSSIVSQEDKLVSYLRYLKNTAYCTDTAFIEYAISSFETNMSENCIYVSPDGDGTGDVLNPMNIYDAIDKVKPGQTIYLRAGFYILEETLWLSLSGEKDKYITIKNYPNEKAIITSSLDNINKYSEDGEYLLFGLDEKSQYLVIEGLEFCDITAKYSGGIVGYDGGENHIIIKNNIFHNFKTTKNNDYNYGANAILFMGESQKSINNILVMNNYCHDNILGYSECISFAGNCENIYVINNKVFDNSNIGIDFYGNAGYCNSKSLDQPRNCVAALNEIKNSCSSYASCAGLYVDGAKDTLLENNVIYYSQYGIEIGSEEKVDDYPVKDIIVRNNVIYDNLICGIRIGGYETKQTGVVKNCKIYNNTLYKNGECEIIISKVDGISFFNNLVYAENDYIFTDFDENYIKNINFSYNYFEGSSYFTMFSKKMLLDEFNQNFGEQNITGNMQFETVYYILNNEIIKNKGSNVYDLEFDFNFETRIKEEVIDIGAVEY